MGGQSTKGKSIEYDSGSASMAPVPENNGLVLNNILINRDSLEMLLSYCDLQTLKNIRLVCSEWLQLTSNNSFFKALYDNHGLAWWSIPEHIKTHQFAPALLMVAFKKNAFRTNMINNPSGESGLEYWESDTNQSGVHIRSCWSTESPPMGCNSLITLPNSCFATSYLQSNVRQYVNIGLSDEITNLLTPFEVRFSVKTAARFDCGGVGDFVVEEVNNVGTQVVNRLTLRMTEGETDWVKYSFAAYFPHGEKKYVCPSFLVTLGGKDLKFWAGNYGLKFAHLEAIVKPLSPAEAENPLPEFPRTEILPKGITVRLC